MISERLKILINYMNLSQKDFAVSIGLTPSSLNDILNGRTKNISRTLLIAIRYVYNVNPTWLLKGEGEMFNTPSDVKDGKVSYTAISDISDITRTRWFKNLTKEQREIITHLASVKDRGILKKVSDIMSRQSAKEKGDLELEELDRELKRK